MQYLIQYALSFVGQPYRWGGDDAIDGFDCSGLVQEILASVGLDPKGDQTAQNLYNELEKNSTHGVMEAGALVFFGESVTKITHVGFCIDQWRMIEAGGGGSRTLSRADAAAQNAFVRIRPVANRKDLVAAIKPRYFVRGIA